jgi:hypothetical protein
MNLTPDLSESFSEEMRRELKQVKTLARKGGRGQVGRVKG